MSYFSSEMARKRESEGDRQREREGEGWGEGRERCGVSRGVAVYVGQSQDPGKEKRTEERVKNHTQGCMTR